MTNHYSVQEVLSILSHVFVDAKSELNFSNNFELLIAVMLSAQATDKSVNKVTPNLFARYGSPKLLGYADYDDVVSLIQTIGLYRNKAKNIIDTSRILSEDFKGIVPDTREALMSLPGVGRKTANVVIAVGFDKPAIAVDTHVERVTKRLGWVDNSASVLEVEEALMHLIPKHLWKDAHHWLLLFGRYYSTARNNEDVYEILERLKEMYDEKSDN